MEFIVCICISMLFSIGYTNFRINQYDKLICEHIKDTSQVTFDMLLELLKKVGIIKN